MLERLPHWLGAALRNVRAGHSRLVIVQDGIVPADTRLELSSPAFAMDARLPARFTADGAGVSPPLAWSGVPAAAAGLALIVEDPDAPFPQPLVHAIVWNLPARDGALPEGGIVADGDGGSAGEDSGRNSYGREGWLPPDPPPGHGAHDYVFQLFALSDVPQLSASPGRGAFVDAIRGRVLAAGLLTGSYARD